MRIGLVRVKPTYTCSSVDLHSIYYIRVREAVWFTARLHTALHASHHMSRHVTEKTLALRFLKKPEGPRSDTQSAHKSLLPASNVSNNSCTGCMSESREHVSVI